MKKLILTLLLTMPTIFLAQTPPIEPGVSLELARWRAARYSDVRYKMNLTLEKMSPVLKGTMEIRVRVREAETRPVGSVPPIVLDWRKIRGHEDKSAVSNVTVNGKPVLLMAGENHPVAEAATPLLRKEGSQLVYHEQNEHLIFRDGVVAGENVIKLDFTSPILASGSAITRYVDKEDGSEYIYSLFVPSDASTAFPVFDQPDLKARFTLMLNVPEDWAVVSNAIRGLGFESSQKQEGGVANKSVAIGFRETKPISTYVFAFAAGNFAEVTERSLEDVLTETRKDSKTKNCVGCAEVAEVSLDVVYRKQGAHIFLRKSQLGKFKLHAAEVFRLNREAVKYFEQYFDYKFPFPKYDLVLIPEFPFGGMEHAGATFLRESSIIFPQEPTKNDHINRATLIFHEAAHQWFGDTVTMRWFDDLWLKEGFATFTAYKAMEKIMPEMNAWKVFYERIKQGAYQTDSTRGTTAIYQPIANLSAAKSAYGNIVYNKAPAFLRQAEFYLGEDKFQTAVQAFLKKHEFGNAGWEDLVKEFETASDRELKEWATKWVKTPGVAIAGSFTPYELCWMQESKRNSGNVWDIKVQALLRFEDGSEQVETEIRRPTSRIGFECTPVRSKSDKRIIFGFPNYGDYGYGIFLLDEKSRDYVLKNIRREKDPFLRSMMWGALWDSVREGELDPRVFVELAIKNLPLETDESITASVLGRVSTAINYYLNDAGRVAVTRPLEQLIETEMLKIGNSLGRRITFYRNFLNVGASIRAREVYKQLLQGKFAPKAIEIGGGLTSPSDNGIPLKTKDKFDIVTRLLILGDPHALKLLADLEKNETSDDAKRYAYAARAGIATAENKAKYWNDFVSNKDISESWIEAAFGPWNAIRHSDLTLPYLQKALQELPNHKRNRKIFFVNGWLGAFIGGQRSEEALAVVNKFLADNPGLDNDLRLKVLENVDLIERAVRVREGGFPAKSQSREGR